MYQEYGGGGNSNAMNNSPERKGQSPASPEEVLGRIESSLDVDTLTEQQLRSYLEQLDQLEADDAFENAAQVIQQEGLINLIKKRLSNQTNSLPSVETPVAPTSEPIVEPLIPGVDATEIGEASTSLLELEELARSTAEATTTVDTTAAPENTEGKELIAKIIEKIDRLKADDLTLEELNQIKREQSQLLIEIIRARVNPMVQAAEIDAATALLAQLRDDISYRLEHDKPADPKKPEDLSGISAVELRLRGMTNLKALLNDMETTSLADKETSQAFIAVIRARTAEVAAEIVDEKEREAFIKLIEHIMMLFDFGVLSNKGIHVGHVTVVSEDDMLDNLGKTSGGRGAAMFNTEFNTNLLVRSGVVEIPDPTRPHIKKTKRVDNEQFMEGAGIIQNIVCVMYALMKDVDAKIYIDHDKGILDTNDKGVPYNRFARDGDYPDGRTQDLVNYVTSLESYTIQDESGKPQIIHIRDEFNRFPEKVREVLKYIATLKASRDDLGNKASNFIMVKYGKSPKLGGTGSGFDAAGYVARTVYSATETSDKREHAAALSYVDPTELSELDPNKVVPNDSRRTILLRKMAENDNYFSYHRPGWETLVEDTHPDENKSKFWDDIEQMVEEGRIRRELLRKTGGDPRRLRITNRLRFMIHRWDYDFPSLDNHTNRVDDALASNRKLAKNAFKTLIEYAYTSTIEKFSSDSAELQGQIKEKMAKMTKKIAEVISVLGKPDIDITDPDAVIPDKWKNPYTPYHGMVLSAAKFFVANIIIDLPVKFVSPGEDALNRLTSAGNNRLNQDALHVYETGREAILEQMREYPSIVGVYQDALKKIAEADWLKPKYEYTTTRRNKFHRRRIALDSNLSKRSDREKDTEYSRAVSMPFEAAPDPKEKH